MLGFLTWLAEHSNSASPVIKAEAKRLLEGEEDCEAWKGRLVKGKTQAA